MQKQLLLLFCLLTLLFDNPLLAQCPGGMVFTNQGATTAYICLEDGQDDFVNFTNNSLSPSNYVYLITDDNNQILSINTDGFANFEGAPIGDCRVWGLSFDGELLAIPGMDAATATLAGGCFELSENYINIVRRNILESNLMLLSGGQGNIIAIDDNDNAMVMVGNTEVLSDNYVYVLTRADSKIIDINESGIFDFPELQPANYLIYGYHYSGNIQLVPGNYLSGATPFADGCFRRSNNSIIIQKTSESTLTGCLAEGATVTTQQGATIAYACVGNGTPDFVGFTNTSISGSAYQYLITDENNVILSIPPSGFANFEGTPAGDCRVWGVSYEGNFMAQPGDDAATAQLADGCFDLSDNYIDIIRRQIEFTQVLTADSMTSIAITDNEAAEFGFINSGNNDADYAYIITREDNRIVGVTDESFDFQFQPAGKYFVYGFSYVGDIILEVGMQATGWISNACSAKSFNLIYVEKETEAAIMNTCTAEAGTLTADFNTVELVAGVAGVSATDNGDAVVPDMFDVTYVLTSGDDLVIEMINPVPFFSASETGTYRIHTLIAELNDPSSDDFFDGTSILFGTSTAAEVLGAIEAQGVCASLDVDGVTIEVVAGAACTAEAGLLMADVSEVPLGLFTFLSASTIVEPVVPTGFEVFYILTTGSNETIVQTADAPAFLVEEAGVYKIYTVVAETSNDASPDFFNRNSIVLGGTSYATLAIDLAFSGVCAALDGLGTTITVTDGSATKRAEISEGAVALTMEATSIQLFPNPASEVLQVNAKIGPSNIGTYHIIDLIGNVWQTGYLDATRDIQRLDISSLPNGQYLLTLQSDNQSLTKKFVKMY